MKSWITVRRGGAVLALLVVLAISTPAVYAEETPTTPGTPEARIKPPIGAASYTKPYTPGFSAWLATFGLRLLMSKIW